MLPSHLRKNSKGEKVNPRPPPKRGGGPHTISPAERAAMAKRSIIAQRSPKPSGSSEIEAAARGPIAGPSLTGERSLSILPTLPDLAIATAPSLPTPGSNPTGLPDLSTQPPAVPYCNGFIYKDGERPPFYKGALGPPPCGAMPSYYGVPLGPQNGGNGASSVLLGKRAATDEGISLASPNPSVPVPAGPAQNSEEAKIKPRPTQQRRIPASDRELRLATAQETTRIQERMMARATTTPITPTPVGEGNQPANTIPLRDRQSQARETLDTYIAIVKQARAGNLPAEAPSVPGDEGEELKLNPADQERLLKKSQILKKLLNYREYVAAIVPGSNGAMPQPVRREGKMEIDLSMDEALEKWVARCVKYIEEHTPGDLGGKGDIMMGSERISKKLDMTPYVREIIKDLKRSRLLNRTADDDGDGDSDDYVSIPSLPHDVDDEADQPAAPVAENVDDILDNYPEYQGAKIRGYTQILANLEKRAGILATQHSEQVSICLDLLSKLTHITKIITKPCPVLPVSPNLDERVKHFDNALAVLSWRGEQIRAASELKKKIETSGKEIASLDHLMVENEQDIEYILAKLNRAHEERRAWMLKEMREKKRQELQ
ncbi:hypothetical protein GGR50DRAFT_696262 [Xylaria sp. CBS 124048]|nr:hypothetical protein GGR50DRAFT_696262 [Xylaria sp. CBS 124048]